MLGMDGRGTIDDTKPELIRRETTYLLLDQRMAERTEDQAAVVGQTTSYIVVPVVITSTADKLKYILAVRRDFGRNLEGKSVNCIYLRRGRDNRQNLKSFKLY